MSAVPQLRELPLIDVLRAIVSYNPATGVLTFKPRENVRPCWNSKHAGKVAINTASPDGYRRGYLLSQMMLAHRVAFALYTGRTNFGAIDHINGDRGDNRIDNLRLADASLNGMNQCRRSDNTSGVTGVNYHPGKGKWIAQICAYGDRKYLGAFKTKREAVMARLAAQQANGLFGPNHGSSPKGISIL